MTPEDRLREALAASATDPGPKEEWDSFLKIARRDRTVHRVLRGASILAAVGLVTIGGVLIDRSFEADRRPDIADEQDRESAEEKLEEVEERVRETEELIEDIGIVPGPNEGGVRKSGVIRPENPRGPSDTRTLDPKKDSVVAEVPSRCRGARASIVGTPGDDVLRGTAGNDVMNGLGGDDEIHGAGGDDYICGSDGIDHLFGDAGKDSLVGGPGDDYMDGGAGFDFIQFPGAPADINIDLSNGFVEGDGNDDVVRVEGAEGTKLGDNFVGDGGPNLFAGGSGDDAMNGLGGRDVFFPGLGNDAIAGHGGVDTVAFTSPTGRSGVEVDLSNNIATGEGIDRLNDIENINGTFRNDVIYGDEEPNSFFGSLGDDTLSGGSGDDVMIGWDGNDILDGGTDIDALDGGSGDDRCANGETETSCETTGPLGALLLWLAVGASRLRQRK